MPAVADSLSALITFTLPASALDHSEDIYLAYPPPQERPKESVRVAVSDLRPLIDGKQSPTEQLKELGYGVARHESKHLDGLPSKEGTQLYLDETAEIMRQWLGCTRVIAWNSVCRKNDAAVQLKHVEKQKGPEKGFIPTERLQPVAGVAHVDQDAKWGKELCSKAMDKSADDVKRVMIVNLWRPLHGPVTNAPLFACSFDSINEKEDLSLHGHLFGVGYDMHHSTKQQWGYIRHQMPDEVLLLKCYDSEQGKDGSALFSAHVAGDVGEQDWIDGEAPLPRESIEVRCVAVWE